jgi:uncharacterized protein YecE (DUF72 family)
MGRPQVGLPSLQGDIAKYEARFDMVELRLDSMAPPKPATLKAWRKAVNPSFTFAVVLPREIGTLEASPKNDRAIQSALKLATILQARCIVLETPADVRPTKANRDKLKNVFAKLALPSIQVCWEPHGVWEPNEILSTAKTLGVLPVLDATRDRLPAGSAVYTRVRALGRTGVSEKAIAKLAEQLHGRREAWVVIEDRRSAARVKAGISGALSELGGAAPPVIVKPSPGRLRAEDEEQ